MFEGSLMKKLSGHEVLTVIDVQTGACWTVALPDASTADCLMVANHPATNPAWRDALLRWQHDRRQRLDQGGAAA